MSKTLALNLPAPHEAQQKVIAESRRFNVVACGRRWGKTVLGSDRLIHPALKGQPVAWFAPNYKLLSEAWRELTETLKPVTLEANKQERRITLHGGGSLEAWSLDSPDAGRGRKYACVVIDEAAMIPDLEQAWTQAIRPTLTDLKGYMWACSTPRGIGNYFYSLFRRGQDPEMEDWMSWQMPTTANCFIDPSEVEAARQDLSEIAFSQEMEAKFVSWTGSVFRNILPAVYEVPERIVFDTNRPWLSAYQPRFAIGVDWARTNDYTVYTVISTDAYGDTVYDDNGRAEQTFAVVEIDRFRGVEYSLQRARLHALYQRYNRPAVLVESNSIGQPMLEELAKGGMRVQGFTTTNATKASIVEDLALAFERRTIRIPNYAPLIGELSAFEAQKLPSGLTRYSAPEGENDDTVMSLAIALRCLKTISYRYDPQRIARMNQLAGMLGQA